MRITSAICTAGVLAACCVLGATGYGNGTNQPLVGKDADLVIKLRWIKSFPSQSRSDVDTGLYWALSFLGAKLPADAVVISWDGTSAALDLDAAGVGEKSKAAWRKLLHVLKSSDEYRKMGGIDAGRFVYLSLCSSYQYYALTGVNLTYPQFRAAHAFAPKQVAIVESAVAKGNRLIEVGEGKDIRSVAFVAFEGSGALQNRSFQQADIETLDLMENGQLRFGLYDLEGHLKAATTPSLTAAGKPSKCLWCHEINLQPPFKNVTDVPGYFSTNEFKELIAGATRIIAGYRKTLASKVDFTHLQDHTRTEELYLSFAEPTARRLAAEWNMPVGQVEQLLASRNLKSHAHSERLDDDVLGDNLFDRNEVDPLAPYRTIRGPSDMREASSYEPNLLQ